LLHLQPGNKVLDLGCGPGSDTLALSKIVGALGQVHGADHDPDMVAQANRRAEDAGLANRVTHLHADACALPWPDNYFDASRSERLFQHLQEPERALAEMVRVTRSGGWIVVVDADWGAFSIDSDESDIERRLVQYHAKCMVNNAYAGRTLYRLFKEQVLQDISADVWPISFTDYALTRKVMRLDLIEREAFAAGIITARERKRWQASLAKAAATDTFFASCSGTAASGRKP
jgi:ubiquinone/menaquinone biosynthesis C-methylase UbiE